MIKLTIGGRSEDDGARLPRKQKDTPDTSFLTPLFLSLHDHPSFLFVVLVVISKQLNLSMSHKSMNYTL